MFQFYCLNGNNKHPFETGRGALPDLERPLGFVTGFMARHEKGRIIEAAINMRFNDLIHIAANAANQPDV